MATMAKLRNRLSLGSWNIPLSRSRSRSKRESPSTSRTSSSVTKEREAENSSGTGASNITTPDGDSATEGNNLSTPGMTELATIISRETEKVNKYFKARGSPMPSFNVDAPLDFPKLPEDIKKAREEVIRATKELSDLMTGPRERVRWMALDYNNSLSLHIIYHYQIAKSFPIHETATYAQVAESVGLDEVNVRRSVRHAMTNGIFREVSPNVIAHTAASRVLAEDAVMNDWVGFCAEDIWPAASKVVTALKKYPSASEPTQTGFNFSNDTTNKEPMFATFGRDPTRAKRMGGAMASLTGGEGYEVSYLLDGYDWASLNASQSTIVDVGGSHGFVCVELAKRFPDLRFVVQDLPKTVASAPKLDGEMGSRVSFQAHDFFTPQPVKGADVYLFRWIFHNHSDKYASLILKNLIPALKKGSRILINDYCLHEGYGMEKTLLDEKTIRGMDLIMLTLLNSRERNEGEYKALFEGAHTELKFNGVKRAKGCRMSVVEAVWEGDDYSGAVETTKVAN